MDEKPALGALWLNNQSEKGLRAFVMKKAKEPVSETWLDEIELAMESFPLPELLIGKLDNFWHHLVFHAEKSGDTEFLIAYIKLVEAFSSKHDSVVLKSKLHDYKSELMIFKQDD